MSIEEVAARAGVGKTTIYRRWPSKGLLALDAFVASFREEQPLPDTGTLRGDLLSALHTWVRAVTQTPMGSMLTGLIAALCGQGLQPFAAAQLGTYLHGLAGDLARDQLGEVSLIATDLLSFLPAAFRCFQAGR